MGFGPFSSESNSKQESVSVADQGQYNKKSDVAQSGSTLVGRKATLAGLNLAGAKLQSGSNLTINEGPNVSDLVSQLTQATDAQIQSAINGVSQNITGTAAGQPGGSTPDANAPAAPSSSSKTMWIVAAAVAAVALLAVILRKK